MFFANRGLSVWMYAPFPIIWHLFPFCFEVFRHRWLDPPNLSIWHWCACLEDSCPRLPPQSTHREALQRTAGPGRTSRVNWTLNLRNLIVWWAGIKLNFCRTCLSFHHSTCIMCSISDALFTLTRRRWLNLLPAYIELYLWKRRKPKLLSLNPIKTWMHASSIWV